MSKIFIQEWEWKREGKRARKICLLAWSRHKHARKHICTHTHTHNIHTTTQHLAAAASSAILSMPTSSEFVNQQHQGGTDYGHLTIAIIQSTIDKNAPKKIPIQPPKKGHWKIYTYKEATNEVHAKPPKVRLERQQCVQVEAETRNQTIAWKQDWQHGLVKWMPLWLLHSAATIILRLPFNKIISSLPSPVYVYVPFFALARLLLSFVSIDNWQRASL